MAMSVEPNLKPFGPCEGRADTCKAVDCPLEKTYRTKAFRDGLRRVKGCKDIVARNSRSATKGNDKGRRARQALAIAGVNSRHEEVWGGSLRVEVKAGGQIAPAYTAFRKAEAQSEAARPIGDVRPFAAVFMPDGTTDGIVCCRISTMYDVATALLENRAAS